jgi:hypothetical protein
VSAAPPHSVGRSRDPIEREVYDERNSFLYLLLGLIAVSERVLSVVPGLVGAPPPAEAPAAPPARQDGPALLR